MSHREGEEELAAAAAAEAAGDERPGDGLRDLLVRPLKARGVALTGLFVLAVFYTLFFARAFFLPLVLALLLNLLLAPVVAGLARLRVPQSVAAGLVVLALVGAIAGSTYMLIDPAGEWMEKAPSSLAKVERKLRRLKEPVARVNRATEEVQKLTDVDGGRQRNPQQVQVQAESLSGSLARRVGKTTGGAAVVLVLLYFLLASGDLFLRKLIRILPTLEDKKRAVDIARQLERDLSRYLATVTLINLGLGLAVGGAMYLLHLPNPMLWGVMATVLNFVPYLGAIVGILVIGLVATLTFDGLGADPDAADRLLPAHRHRGLLRDAADPRPAADPEPGDDPAVAALLGLAVGDRRRGAGGADAGGDQDLLRPPAAAAPAGRVPR